MRVVFAKNDTIQHELVFKAIFSTAVTQTHAVGSLSLFLLVSLAK